MPEHSRVAFLRGMNLGGRRLANDDLVDAVRGCGCGDVVAYQASGNIVFNDPRPTDELEAALSDGLAEALGYPVPVFLRDADEVRTIATATPSPSPSSRAAGPSRRSCSSMQSRRRRCSTT